MDRAALLFGLLVGGVVGAIFGVTFEKFARARRDFKGAKATSVGAGRVYRRVFMPRMLMIGFVCACLGVAAVRALAG